MKCGKCGTEIPEGFKFCGRCGQPLEATSGVGPSKASVQQRQRPSRLLMVGVGVLAVAVLAICSCGVLILMTPSKQPGSAEVPSASRSPVATEVVFLRGATNTPMPTLTASPSSTATPVLTLTPTRPPATAKPTVTPTPAFASQTQKLGPIRETSRDEEYTAQVTVRDVKFSGGDPSGFDTPRSGNIFVVVYVNVRDLGPGTIHSLYTSDFQIKDANGVVRNEDYIVYLAKDCNLPLIDLSSGGNIDGCASFEVPATGKLEFIFAPYQYEGLKPGRYLSFVIRP